MPGKRILVVDSAENIRRNLQTLLAGHGFAVTTAASATEAVRSAEASRPRAVLVATRSLGGGELGSGHPLASSPSLAEIPLVEAHRVHEILRELQDGWQRCGAASRELLSRLERRMRTSWNPTTLLEAPPEHEAADLSGDLPHFPLTDVLNSIAGCGLSGRLAVVGRSISGAIFIESGEFVHARLDNPYPCDDFRESLDLLLTLRDGRFALYVEEIPTDLADRPRRPLMAVLLERVRLRDEGPTELRPIGLPL